MMRYGMLLITLMALLHGPSNAASIDEIRHTIAPTGILQIGVYRGSPSSIIEGATAADAKGVGLDLGRALAAKLEIPYAVVVFSSNDALLAATVKGDVDVIYTNRTSERAKSLDFSQTFMDVAKSFLVPGDSSLVQISDLKQPGLHVGVSKGSSTAMELLPIYPDLTVEPVATLAVAAEMLTQHKLDAFATNDAILFQMSDGMAGSRVLPGQWGLEHFAAALPKGRNGALPFLETFVAGARADGTVARAIQRSTLRGTLDAVVVK